MGRKTFENYAKRAEAGLDYTSMAGRYTFNSEAEEAIASDVAGKLALRQSDEFLEIGSGPGAVILPLFAQVKSATAIDNQEMLTVLQSRPGGAEIAMIAGNFFDLDVGQRFDKILVYSVLHCLASRTEVLGFIDKALDLLKPGGRALFGDIPNVDLKSRFVNSGEGKRFSAEWSAAVKAAREVPELQLEPDTRIVEFDDAFITEILRRVRADGRTAYLMPQDLNLPFSRTREDILVTSFA